MKKFEIAMMMAFVLTPAVGLAEGYNKTNKGMDVRSDCEAKNLTGAALDRCVKEGEARKECKDQGHVSDVDLKNCVQKQLNKNGMD